ncbi:HlyD family secretion protein [Pedobacter nutrimenti]|uniref:Membrane fusion protein (Multidrug efflux system) n=1 Tax=Pedobacter nutrimenti TaxID=1241337 RepID=A0A318UFR2_9SPHI|nr:HlyD family secretion protein [Pedobacter nutrimenti]PYF75011.1 membrane fusion protein (multidrug efflux system) [Pedobacter nutrimenti]|eukprot:gene11864-13827_t
MEKEEKKQSSAVRTAKIGGIGIVAIVVCYFAFNKVNHALNFESTDNAQIETNSVPVLSRIAGYIDHFTLSDYQLVKEGDTLALIDDSEYVLAVKQAEADLLAAKADLTAAESQIPTIGSNKEVASAGLSVEEVALQKAKRDVARDAALFKEGSITQRQYENSESAYQTALKQVVSSKSKVTQAGVQTGTAQAQIEKARATVAAKETALAKARLNLSYTHIIAPASGKIGKTNLKKGQYVQGGQPLFSLISNDRYWIVANFKETQIEHMKIGQHVEIKVDGYPDHKISGKISGFSDATGAKFSLLPPDNSTGNFVKVTQRVPVTIEIDRPETYAGILKAGLSVEADVKVH